MRKYNVIMNEKEVSTQFMRNPYKGKLISRNITYLGRRTSARLEHEFWESLRKICEIEKCNLSELLNYIDKNKYEESSFSSSVRIFVLSYFMSAVTQEGHLLARHGTILRPHLKDDKFTGKPDKNLMGNETEIVK